MTARTVGQNCDRRCYVNQYNPQFWYFVKKEAKDAMEPRQLYLTGNLTRQTTELQLKESKIIKGQT